MIYKRNMCINTQLGIYNNTLGLKVTLNSTYDYYQLIPFLSYAIEKTYDNWYKIWPKEIFIYKDNENIRGFDTKTYDDVYTLDNNEFKFLNIDNKPKFRTILNLYLAEYNKYKNLICM